MTPKHIAQFTPFLHACLICMIAVIFTAISILFCLYSGAGIGWWYAFILTSTLLFFTLPTIVLRKSHDLHIHHTNIGMFCAVLLGYQNFIVTFLHGVSNGVMIEGGARWGYDPIWEKKNEDYDCESDYGHDNIRITI